MVCGLSCAARRCCWLLVVRRLPLCVVCCVLLFVVNCLLVSGVRCLVSVVCWWLFLLFAV